MKKYFKIKNFSDRIDEFLIEYDSVILGMSVFIGVVIVLFALIKNVFKR